MEDPVPHLRGHSAAPLESQFTSSLEILKGTLYCVIKRWPSSRDRLYTIPHNDEGPRLPWARENVLLYTKPCVGTSPDPRNVHTGALGVSKSYSPFKNSSRRSGRRRRQVGTSSPSDRELPGDYSLVVSVTAGGVRVFDGCLGPV